VAASAAGNAIHVIGGVIVLAVHVAFPDVGIFVPFVPWTRQSSGPGGEAGRNRRWIFGAWFTFLDVYFLPRGVK
jgi:hypothetical protein